MALKKLRPLAKKTPPPIPSKFENGFGIFAFSEEWLRKGKNKSRAQKKGAI
jgi:hypothetical protein